MPYFRQFTSGFGIHLVNSKKDPFAPFEDWLVDGPVGKWPEPWEGEKRLTPAQMNIVSANAKLLLDKTAWEKRVSAFESALAKEENDEVREEKRGIYRIRFDHHEFQYLNVARANFPCLVSFANVKFCGVTNFLDTRFKRFASFDKSIFEQPANFVFANFYDSVNFNGSTHLGGTIFSHSIFEGSLFLSAGFDAQGSFEATDIKVAIDLIVKSKFHGAADFARLEVKGSTSFSGSEFAQIPNFSDAKFDRPPAVAGIVVPAPETKKEKWWHLGIAADANDVAKLRKLKAMALHANDHEKDGEFFAKEMLAKRGWETKSFSGLLFNTIYWKLSDFGQSFVRPVLWMGASIYSFFCAYLGVINWQLGTYALPPSSDEILVAFSLSVFNFLPLLGGLFRFAKTPDDHVSGFSAAYGRLAEKGLDVDLLVWLNVFQNIIGAVLLFLFLLALRNKFRLK